MYIHLYSDSSDCLGSKYCACCWLYWLRISVMCKVRLAMLSRRPPRRVSSSSIASTYSCNINNLRRVTHITIKYIIIPTKICCAASASPAFWRKSATFCMWQTISCPLAPDISSSSRAWWYLNTALLYPPAHLQNRRRSITYKGMIQII